jgi:hypothetical protein
VQIKHWGWPFWRMSKRTYLAITVVELVAVAALLAVALSVEHPRFGLEEKHLNALPPVRWLLDHLLWFVSFAVILVGVDTYFTLRVFADKEAEQRRKAAGKTGD